MKYCITYNSDFRHFDLVDEIVLSHYSGGDTILSFVPSLVKENKNKRIILDLSYSVKTIEETIIYVRKLREAGYGIAIKLDMSDKDLVQPLKDNNIPFMFSTFCINMEMAYTQAKLGASDIYVVEELGFRLKDLQYIRNNFPVKIRVLPNVVQRQNRELGVMSSFWIRPEDTELYEPYVDVFELLDWSDDRPGSRLSVLFEVYKQRQWKGNLNDIILDFDSVPVVNNTGINPHFGEMRINCGKRCYMGKCNLCGQAADLAQVFAENGIQLIKPKFKEETTEEQIEKAKELLNEYRIDKASSNSESTTTV